MMRQPDYDRAAHLAYRSLLKLNITELPVRPLEILRKCRHTVVYTYQQAAENLHIEESEFDKRYGDADAFTIRGGEQYVVCYRPGGNSARLNFTLAHELGHILLKHTEDTNTEEAEANCFASHLLCPVPVVEGMAAEEIAASCYVSRAAALAAMENRRGRCEKETIKKVKKLFEKGIDK